MSVRYIFTDKDDKSLSKDPKLQNNGCWGFLKNMQGNINENVCNYKRFLDTKKAQGAEFNPNYWPNSYKTGEPEWCGIPIHRAKDVAFMRVYDDSCLDRGKGSAHYNAIGNLKWLTPKLPQWFCDFNHKYGADFQDITSGEYFLIDMNTSSLRNYNALRMFRNLQNRVSYDAQNETPLVQLILTQLVTGWERQSLYNARCDSLSVPIFDYESLEGIIQVLHDGPILKRNSDEPLNNITNTYSKEANTPYPFNRAFLPENKQGGRLLPKDIPRDFYKLVPHVIAKVKEMGL